MRKFLFIALAACNVFSTHTHAFLTEEDSPTSTSSKRSRANDGFIHRHHQAKQTPKISYEVDGSNSLMSLLPSDIRKHILSMLDIPSFKALACTSRAHQGEARNYVFSILRLVFQTDSQINEQLNPEVIDSLPRTVRNIYEKYINFALICDGQQARSFKDFWLINEEEISDGEIELELKHKIYCFSYLQRSRFMWKNSRAYPVTEYAKWPPAVYWARFSQYHASSEVSEEFCMGEIEFEKRNYSISCLHFLRSVNDDKSGWQLLDWDRCTAYAKIGLILSNPKSGVEFSAVSARKYFLLSMEDNGLNLSCDLRQQICDLLIEDFTHGKGGHPDEKRVEEFTQLKKYLKDREFMDRGHLDTEQF